MRDLEPAEPECRKESKGPGEIIHIDIKKLGRFERIGHQRRLDRFPCIAARTLQSLVGGGLKVVEKRTRVAHKGRRPQLVPDA